MQLRDMISAMSLAFSGVTCSLPVLITLPQRACRRHMRGVDSNSFAVTCFQTGADG